MNYPNIKLGDIFKIQSGGTPSRKNSRFYENGTIPWVKTGNLKVKYINEVDEYITLTALDQSSAKLFPPKTVLVAMYGATIGACAISNIECATNQACAAFLPNSDVNEEYLYYCLSNLKPYFIQQAVGGAQPNISLNFLNNIFIPLPPLPEQQRIAAVLSAADALCQKRRDTLVWLEQLVQSTFYEMFGDPLENPKGWPVVQVSDFVANFESGKSITASNLQEETDYKVLKISAVTGNSFNLSETKPLPQDYIPPQHHLVQQGDLLFSRANTSELVGATAYVFETEPNIALPDKIWRFKWKEPKIVSPLYCWILFSNPFIQNQIANNASGSSGSMKNISQAKMMQMQVICPPLELQNRFETALLEIYARQKAYQQSLQNLESLFDSLMYHAFQGHLVFSDEGIENLMAQMQAEAA